MPFTASTEPVPAEVVGEEFVLRPITIEDVERDYDAVMDSREHLRLWGQGTWPEDDFTVEANLADLRGMVDRRNAHRAFDFTVLAAADRATCLGCVYVFATDAKFLAKQAVTPLRELDWAAVDAAVYFWVRPAQMRSGMDGRLLETLRCWFRAAWGFRTTAFVTSATFDQQVELLRSSGLELSFELVDPDTTHRSLAFC